VGGDAVGARRLAVERRSDRIGLAATAPAVARFPKRCHVINIYTQFQHAD